MELLAKKVQKVQKAPKELKVSTARVSTTQKSTMLNIINTRSSWT